ncbi:unnamed protein product [Closterium sp. Naga37s-1]|nr:unnamed protein product [Closterium sp. Naga37s-1]
MENCAALSRAREAAEVRGPAGEMPAWARPSNCSDRSPDPPWVGLAAATPPLRLSVSHSSALPSTCSCLPLLLPCLLPSIPFSSPHPPFFLPALHLFRSFPFFFVLSSNSPSPSSPHSLTLPLPSCINLLALPPPLPTQIRGTDAANLAMTRVVQTDLWGHQFPPPGSCSGEGEGTRKLLVVAWPPVHGFGIGAQMHIMSAALSLAVAYDRILTVLPGSFEHAAHAACRDTGHPSSLSCYFLPISSLECERAGAVAVAEKRAPYAPRNLEEMKVALASDEPVYYIAANFPWPLRFKFQADAASLWGSPWYDRPITVHHVGGSPAMSDELLKVHWWRSQSIRFFLRSPTAYLCHLTNSARHHTYGFRVALSLTAAAAAKSAALEMLRGGSSSGDGSGSGSGGGGNGGGGGGGGMDEAWLGALADVDGGVVTVGADGEDGDGESGRDGSGAASGGSGNSSEEEGSRSGNGNGEGGPRVASLFLRRLKNKLATRGEGGPESATDTSSSSGGGGGGSRSSDIQHPLWLGSSLDSSLLETSIWPLNPAAAASGRLYTPACATLGRRGEVGEAGEGDTGEGKAGQGEGRQGEEGQGGAGQGEVVSWAGLSEEPYLPRPIVSVHVRQGDKAGEMRLLPLRAFVAAAQHMRRNAPNLNHIWLSTEMQSVIEEAKEQHRDWTFLFTQNPRQEGAMTMHEYEAAVGADVLVGLSFVNLIIASQCDYFVGTLGSNWNRLIDELRCTNGRLFSGYLALNHGQWR